MICHKCQKAMRIEMRTPVALTEGASTVTLTCNECGVSIVETCRD